MYKYDSIVDRKIKFALVGCGRISKNHFASLDKHVERAEVTDVCDIDPIALESAVKLTGAKGHKDINVLLETSEADVVILTTPSGMHSAQAIRSFEKGFHVISEKPMATRMEDGIAMVKAADEANKRLFIVKQNRRNATLRLLKEAIESGRFGRIYMVNINVFWTRPQDYYSASPWRGTWEYDGGAFMNQASHYVDLLEWLIGPIDSLFAYTGTLERKIEAEDSGAVAVKWRSGAMGSMNVTMLTYPQNLEGSITILGEKGSVRIGGVAVNEIQHWDFSEPHEMDARIKDASYQTTSVYGFGHPLYYDNVINVLQGTAIPETDGRQGLKSLEVLSAIYRSARDGQKVGLPLDL